jgi:DNA-binding response OmpR family regulator
MTKEKILVVEDDPAILTGVVDLLEGEGFAVSSAKDGPAALRAYEQEKPNLVLLDIMIPGRSGLDVCRDIRKKDAATPILMLTAKGQEIDKVVGLEVGADDYIVKPFSVNELLARIRAALRRTRREPPAKDLSPLVFGDVHVDPKTFMGTKAGRAFQVTAREIDLLRSLLRRDGEVVDRTTLLDEVWGIRYEGTTRTLDQHIVRLRQKIEDDPAEPAYITTVYGVGYRFRSAGASAGPPVTGKR